MSKPKTKKLDGYKDSSLLAFNKKQHENEIAFDYRIVEEESTALVAVFDQLFEQVKKDLSS